MTGNNHAPKLEPKQSAQKLLDVIYKLQQELHHAQKDAVFPRLNSDFDRELGFDSLTRAELIQRVEKEFSLTLPEQTLAVIETPRDLLHEILSSVNRGASQTPEWLIKEIQLAETDSDPVQAETLQQVLAWHVENHPQRTHLYVYESAGHIQEISYAMLYQEAQRIAGGLLKQGLQAGQTVAIMLPTSSDYFYSFFGILLARGIPVPIYPPARLSQIEDHLQRHTRILQNAQVRFLLTVKEAKTLSRLLQLSVPTIQAIFTAAELRLAVQPIKAGIARRSDIAFLQYTSGSTGNPKGVTLTHDNLLANVRAMGEVVRAHSTDIFVSWLPVYHDMGLIGAWLGSLYHSMPLVIMPPLLFLSKPQRWLWAIHQYRGTLSPAPNFAYELCLNKIAAADLHGLDLSCWRQAWNGAEPVSANTIQRFSERFAEYGFRPEAMSPTYGLAECSVGLTFPQPGRLPRIDRIQREPMERFGKALPATNKDTHVLQIVGLGQPLPNHQIRILDNSGRELPEREEGRLEFKGPSATCGYFRDPEKTRQLFHGQWLDTGDRAYIAGGELFLTGRFKDIIIRAGRNIYPHELEERISAIPGIRKGCVAAFASHDRRSGTERLIVLAETRETDETMQHQLKQTITELSEDLLGTAADEIVLAAAHTIPKTSSGKIRRAASRELYQQGELGSRQRAVWWQLLRLTLGGVQATLNSMRRSLVDQLYAGYAWLILGMLALPVWSIVAVLPNRQLCWSVTRLGVRLLLKLTATPLTVQGREHLPKNSPCILVANHGSYLDGLLMTVATPIDYSFVAKAELQGNVFARIFLSRLGTEFVERFDRQKGIADAQRIATNARKKRSLLFFPEGTLYRMPGLHEFHMGAFTAAVDAHLPVVPITICGTRSKLRDTSLFPRRGAVSIRISKPLLPQGNDWHAALILKDQARAEILSHCGEPDLPDSSR